MCIIRCKLPLMLISCLAAIAADNYSHLPYFGGRRDAYDDYYDIVVDIGEVAVPEFSTRVQESLVDYLRETYGDGPADWCREFWTGDRGRMCLAHAYVMPGATTTWALKSPGV